MNLLFITAELNEVNLHGKCFILSWVVNCNDGKYNYKAILL